MKPTCLEIEDAIESFTTTSSDTVVVVPCYNEERRLDTNAFVEFAQTYPGIRFLFVDDGSNDETLAVLSAMQIRAPHVLDVLALPKNGGKAEAVRQGLIFATAQGVESVGYFDADLATPLEALIDLKRVLQNLPDIEVVFGSRCSGLGHKIARAPMRRLVSAICGRLARLATGIPLIDTQCGAKIFRNTLALRSAISERFEADWLFDVELALRLTGADREVQKRFYEQPLMQWNEIPGSNIKSTDIFRSGLIMLKLIAQRWSIRRTYRRKANQIEINGGKRVTLCPRFELQDVVQLRHRVADGLTIQTLDLRHVDVVGPSVFSAMIGLCDDIASRGEAPTVLLPDCQVICDAAERAGVTRLFTCRRTS